MNHKIRRVLIAIPVVLFFTQGRAQEKALSLSEAIDLGIQNSKNVRISNARIQEATALTREAMDRRLPDFNVSGSYLRLSSANVSLNSKSSSSTSQESSPSPSQAVYGIANLSLPVYAGGRIRYGIESAKLLEKATRLDADQDRENVIYNLTSAYINLYKATAVIGVVKQNLESSRARDANFARLENNGLLARNDLLKAQLQSSNTELALLDAENDLRLATINMDLLLGFPESQLLTVDTFAQATTLRNFEEYETLALQNRKDVQANMYRVKATGFNIRTAKAAAYPAVALTGGYIAAKIPGLITITNAINIGIGLQYNLASLWKSNTKLTQAKAKEQEAVAMGDLLNDQVRFAINSDYQNLLLSKKRIEVFEKTFEQATENYRITNNKYLNNLVTITDLLDADQALLQARLNRELAKADNILAEKKLLLTAGVLTK